MAVLNTFKSIVGDVHSQSLGVDSSLVEGWVRDTWSEIERLRTWSHLRRRSQIVIPAPVTTGTATFTPQSQIVTIVGGAVSSDHIGRQLQRGVGFPIYDIVGADAGTGTYTIFPEFSETSTTLSAQGYRVFTAYISPPADFLSWMYVVDINKRRRLNTWVTQDEINRYDPQRSIGTYPCAMSGLDFARSYSGRVYSPLRVKGAGPVPTAGGSYNGQYDALLVIEIITTGALDVAEFEYRLNDGDIGTLTCSSVGNSLPMGVDLQWPTGTYTAGDIYVIRLIAKPVLALPRYEIYPHPTELTVLQSLYAAQPTDIEDENWTVPIPLTGDIIALGGREQLARYPGTREKPNPYAQIGRSSEFRERFQDAVMQAMVVDDSIIMYNVSEMEEQWPVAPLPWQRSRTQDMWP